MLRPALAPLACRVISVAVLTGCAGAPQSLPPATAATAAAMVGPQATLYFGGDILTMAGPTPEYVEALVVRGGRIEFAGAKADAERRAGKAAESVDLGGKTLLPGFIDTHGHFIYFGKNLVDADLFGSGSVGDVVARLKAHAPNVPPDAWIVGFGYQARSLREQRTPTIEELDAVSADRPVLIVDSSGHLGAANSAAFRAAGVTASTGDPAGGSFARKADGASLAGPMEETALNMVREKRPPFSGQLADQVALGASRLWASYGQTTAMECGLGLGNDDIALVRNAIDRQLLPIDLYVCAKDSVTEATIEAARNLAADYANARLGSLAQRQDAIVAQANGRQEDSVERLLAARPDLDKRYVNRVRLGGIKFWLDGSLDTAWFTQPYATNPPGKTGRYSGFQQIPDEVLDAAFDKYWATDLQLNMHMNGDAAADQALRAIDKAIAKHGMRDHRPVFVHGTYLRPDQIARLKEVGAVPSFLTTGVTTGGDAVLRLWGPDRASRAMAAQTLSQAGVPFTFSHDAPVTPQPWILPLVDAGVNRTAASGAVVGLLERVSPYVALRAVTASAAYQIKEEKTKGTLEAGKLADLVILERNPLKVDPGTIKDIRVVQTIKEGVAVFTFDSSAVAAAPRPAPGHVCNGETPPGEAMTAEARDTFGLLLTAAGVR